MFRSNCSIFTVPKLLYEANWCDSWHRPWAGNLNRRRSLVNQPTRSWAEILCQAFTEGRGEGRQWDGIAAFSSSASPSNTGSHSFSSLAIFDAMFLKPIEVPEMRLKRTPLRDNRGSLHTSISHWTKESVLGSPCTHKSKNLSRCS